MKSPDRQIATILAVLAVVAISGCMASVKAYPDRSTDISAELAALSAYLKPDVLVTCRQGTKRERKDCRDIYLDASIRSIDLNYSNFEQSLWQESTALGLGSDLLVSLLGTVGSFATSGGGLGTIETAFGPPLAASAAYLTGAKAAFDKRTFFDRSLIVIITSMRSNRANVLVKIRECQFTADADSCPIGMAQSLIDAYYHSGTLPGTLVDMTGNAQEKKIQSDTLMRSVVRGER